MKKAFKFRVRNEPQNKDLKKKVLRVYYRFCDVFKFLKNDAIRTFQRMKRVCQMLKESFFKAGNCCRENCEKFLRLGAEWISKISKVGGSIVRNLSKKISEFIKTTKTRIWNFRSRVRNFVQVAKFKMCDFAKTIKSGISTFIQHSKSKLYSFIQTIKRRCADFFQIVKSRVSNFTYAVKAKVYGLARAIGSRICNLKIKAYNFTQTARSRIRDCWTRLLIAVKNDTKTTGRHVLYIFEVLKNDAIRTFQRMKRACQMLKKSFFKAGNCCRENCGKFSRLGAEWTSKISKVHGSAIRNLKIKVYNFIRTARSRIRDCWTRLLIAAKNDTKTTGRHILYIFKFLKNDAIRTFQRMKKACQMLKESFFKAGNCCRENCEKFLRLGAGWISKISKVCGSIVRNSSKKISEFIKTAKVRIWNFRSRVCNFVQVSKFKMCDFAKTIKSGINTFIQHSKSKLCSFAQTIKRRCADFFKLVRSRVSNFTYVAKAKVYELIRATRFRICNLKLKAYNFIQTARSRIRDCWTRLLIAAKNDTKTTGRHVLYIFEVLKNDAIRTFQRLKSAIEHIVWAWNFIKKFLKAQLILFGRMISGFFIKSWKLLIRGFCSFGKFLKKLGLAPFIAIGFCFKQVSKFIVGIKNCIVSLLYKFGLLLLAFVRWIFRFVKRIIFAPFIVVNFLFKKIKNGFVAIWKAIKSIKERIISGIRNFFTSCWREIQNFWNELRKCGKRILNVIFHPLSILSLSLSIILFFCIKMYDSQIIKVQHSKAAFANAREKIILKSRYQALRRSMDGDRAWADTYHNHNHHINVSSEVLEKRKIEKKSANSPSGFKETVEKFFQKNRVAEILCYEDSCRIKIGDKIFDKYSEIGDVSESTDIFVNGVEGDFIVFADSFGNKYAKEISSFFER